MIVLDTHAFVWWASDRGQLSERARQAIETEPGSLVVSVVTAWEIALLHKKNRLTLPLPPQQFIGKSLERYGIEELALQRKTVLDAVALPDLHDDPFDRIIVAEAIARNSPVVTRDTVIPTYPGVRTIW